MDAPGAPTGTGSAEGFQCPVCTVVSRSRSGLQRHFANVHLTRQELCRICNKTFACKSNLVRHTLTAHSEIKAFRCEICDQQFALNEGLQRHFGRRHEHKKPFKCEICDKDFNTRGEEQAHVKRTHFAAAKQ